MFYYIEIKAILRNNRGGGGGGGFLVEHFACWVIFHAFVDVSGFFSKLTLSKNSFRNTIRVSNGLDPDQDRRPVGPHLGRNCKCKGYLSADVKMRS